MKRSERWIDELMRSLVSQSWILLSLIGSSFAGLNSEPAVLLARSNDTDNVSLLLSFATFI